jgi:hypothetical protein
MRAACENIDYGNSTSKRVLFCLRGREDTTVGSIIVKRREKRIKSPVGAAVLVGTSLLAKTSRQHGYSGSQRYR